MEKCPRCLLLCVIGTTHANDSVCSKRLRVELDAVKRSVGIYSEALGKARKRTTTAERKLFAEQTAHRLTKRLARRLGREAFQAKHVADGAKIVIADRERRIKQAQTALKGLAG